MGKRDWKRGAALLFAALIMAPSIGCAGSPGESAPAGSSAAESSSPFPVEPVRTAEESAQRINNRADGAIKTPATEKATIYQPDGDWSYSHGAAIAWFKGKFYVMFTNGRANEDDCGQRVMYAVSEDGLNWDTPRPLADTQMGEHSELVLQASGFWVNGDTMVAYYNSSEYPEESLRGENLRPEKDVSRLNFQNHALTTTDGVHWTDAGSVTYRRGFFMPTHTGRLIVPGPPSFPYTEDPGGLGKFSISVLNMSNVNARGANILTESCMYQTDDEIIHMMFRTDTGFMWASESYDNGKTWTEPFPTKFTNDNSKFWFGTLPDGRFYCVSNPIMDSGRTPLILSLSDDGENFSDQYLLRNEPYQQQYPGMYKSGIYGYPHALVQGDYLYVVYSKHKEAIEVTRVALSELAG